MIPFGRWTYAARIVHVHDGDTVRADIDLGCGVWLHGETLRLLGIQAPEVGGPGVTAAEKVAGARATTALLELLLTGPTRDLPCYVVTAKDTREGRGRYLARILLDRGGDIEPLDVGAELVRLGHATPYDGKGKAPKWTPTGWTTAR